MESVRSLHSVSRSPLLRQFTKFCIIGVTNTTLDVVVYWMLTRGLGLYYIAAAVLSFVVVITWSFYANRRWTFRSNGPSYRSQYVRFFAVNSLSFVCNIAGFYVLVEYGGWLDLIAKVIMVAVVAVFNFSLNRWWTFRVRG